MAKTPTLNNTIFYGIPTTYSISTFGGTSYFLRKI